MADQFSENDVDSLGEKMEQFSQTLTSGEQAALIEILERATSQQGDVEGFTMRAKVRVRMLVKGALVQFVKTPHERIPGQAEVKYS
jgi:hypothetical protein